MKQIRISLQLTALLVGAVTGIVAPLAAHAAPATTEKPAASQGAQTAQDPAAQAKMKKEMDAYTKLGQPGEHHKRLAGMAGKWTTSGKAWMSPDQPPMTFGGTMEAFWILDGHYLQEMHKSTFMGQPFEGRSIEGYDNVRKEYFSTWIDSMGTGLEVFHGTCDEPCKVLTQFSDGIDPMSGKKIRTRQVTTYVDADTFREEMYVVGAGKDGQDEKTMEMVVKRTRG
jgi:hypothetical protein